MKKLFLPIFMLFLCGAAAAQNAILQGKILDADNNALPGAHLSLEYPWGEQVKSNVSDGQGNFEIPNVPFGGYVLKATFLGYRDFKKEINVKSEKMILEPIILQEASEKLNEVVVKEKAPMATQHGDTTQYNASSFKTLPDASAEDLVEKMPGVVIENGTVQAQGEDVKQVLVDGRPFFGNDPMAALKNLPAEVVDKIQVFDQRSDQAQFTGFDDGETTRTLNIITKVDMRNGQFGKAYAGYGYENKYKAGGNFSIFNGDQRISLIGQSNNINIQNFATEDLLGVVGSGGGRGRGGFRGGGGGRGGGRGGGGRGGRGGGGSTRDFIVPQQGGIAQTHAVGINFSDKWGEKLDLVGSYFFNKSENTSEENLYRQFIDREVVREIYEEDNTTFTDNFNHRLNFRINYQIDSANSIIMRPRVSWQDNIGASNTFGQTNVRGNLLNQTDNDFNSDLSGVDFSNNILFRHRFPKRGRTISLNVGMGYNDKTGESFLNSQDDYYDAMPFSDTLNQFSDLKIRGWNLSSNISYTEPLSRSSQLMLQYRARYQQQDSDKSTFDFSEGNNAYDDLNAPLSSVFKNDYMTQSFGGGYTYRKGAMMAMARANFQWAQLDSDEAFPMTAQVRQTFYNVLPMVMLRYRKSRTDNLMFMYRTSTSNPSVEQLQNVIDNSNPLQLSTGNPNLDQSVSHRVFARFQKTNPEKSTVMFLLLGGSITDNYIGNSIYFEQTDSPIFDDFSLDPGAQISQPVNMKGYWDARFFFTYGVPLKGLKTNLNLNLSSNYSETPGLINDILNISKSTSFRAGIVFASNISEKIDFTISSRTGYNTVGNTFDTEVDNSYINQTSKLRLGWVFSKGIVFRANVNHQLYSGLSDDFNQNYFLWNMSLGKKLFKNQLGEISISVFDLLEQNQSIQRNVTSFYVEDVQTIALQRFVMLNFIYNFRNFNVGKTPPKLPPTEEERRKRWEERRGF